MPVGGVPLSQSFTTVSETLALPELEKITDTGPNPVAVEGTASLPKLQTYSMQSKPKSSALKVTASPEQISLVETLIIGVGHSSGSTGGSQ